ncbi:MAG: 8-oxo-dGTP diphosphatase MutT [Deltaproteobacteria bacterium]|jgi:mutator protein MutT|nr:8-oxo-dGTP diphosphatase MutT [Deltaproteobacteria bacterium]
MAVKKRIEVAAAIIRHNGKILITERPDGTHLEGLWEFPGGKKEKGESLDECIKREIREELGVQVNPLKLLVNVTHEYETKIVELYAFLCALAHGIPVPLEGQRMQWVDPEELSLFRFPPPDQQIIEVLYNGT